MPPVVKPDYNQSWENGSVDRRRWTGPTSYGNNALRRRARIYSQQVGVERLAKARGRNTIMSSPQRPKSPMPSPSPIQPHDAPQPHTPLVELIVEGKEGEGEKATQLTTKGKKTATLKPQPACDLRGLHQFDWIATRAENGEAAGTCVESTAYWKRLGCKGQKVNDSKKVLGEKTPLSGYPIFPTTLADSADISDAQWIFLGASSAFASRCRLRRRCIMVVVIWNMQTGAGYSVGRRRRAAGSNREWLGSRKIRSAALLSGRLCWMAESRGGKRLESEKKRI
ncbi:hypothetical protein BDN72DRAFT_863560 [Pluteus cervinus]|uniref:Uncharacterized protein n=1 Tax=Pluteus cervinus TaxID=181527 RepID=A0ACD3A6N2_9AGAR|nr:hypothetical protein BDN72DRAFT_863560 [Pluteus cervinus]